MRMKVFFYYYPDNCTGSCLDFRHQPDGFISGVMILFGHYINTVSLKLTNEGLQMIILVDYEVYTEHQVKEKDERKAVKMTVHFTEKMIELWNLVSPYVFGHDVVEDAPENIKTAFEEFKRLYKEQKELEMKLSC